MKLRERTKRGTTLDAEEDVRIVGTDLILLRSMYRIGRVKMKTISQQLEEVVNEICNHYCKYPDIWDEEKEGCELSESEVCTNCPLNRL